MIHQIFTIVLNRISWEHRNIFNNIKQQLLHLQRLIDAKQIISMALRIIKEELFL